MAKIVYLPNDIMILLAKKYGVKREDVFVRDGKTISLISGMHGDDITYNDSLFEINVEN